MKNYLTELQYDAAEQDDLWRHLTQQGHRYAIFKKSGNAVGHSCTNALYDNILKNILIKS